jgi:hypothetical protein
MPFFFIKKILIRKERKEEEKYKVVATLTAGPKGQMGVATTTLKATPIWPRGWPIHSNMTGMVLASSIPPRWGWLRAPTFFCLFIFFFKKKKIMSFGELTHVYEAILKSLFRKNAHASYVSHFPSKKTEK